MGEVFAGRYELVDPIGQGGMGAVWRTWDHRRRRYVATKILQQRDAGTLLRFVREQAMRIDHPHVLAPSSWAANDEQVLFTMDLLTGGSISHILADYGPLPAPLAHTLLDQLLSGLAAVHDEGIIHRDIKPANLLLEATGAGRPHLKLSDFGIAVRGGEARLTASEFVIGTPGYLPPELRFGAAEPSPAHDLYAVGVVAIQMLTGQQPDLDTLHQQYTGAASRPTAPNGVPAPLWDVIALLLHPDPEKRFQTATGARRAFAEAAHLLPDQAEPAMHVEVHDQVGPLPPGFGPDGPAASSGAVPPQPAGPGSTQLSAVPTTQQAAQPSPQVSAPASPPPPSSPPPVPASAAGSGMPATSPLPGTGPTRLDPTQAAAGGVAPNATRRHGPSTPVTWLMLLLAVLLLAGGGWAVAGG